MSELDYNKFNVRENKPYIQQIRKDSRDTVTKIDPSTRYSICYEHLRVVDIPDHFNEETQRGIGESIIEAWRKAGIKPILAPYR